MSTFQLGARIKLDKSETQALKSAQAKQAAALETRDLILQKLQSDVEQARVALNQFWGQMQEKHNLNLQTQAWNFDPKTGEIFLQQIGLPPSNG